MQSFKHRWLLTRGHPGRFCSPVLYWNELGNWHHLPKSVIKISLIRLWLIPIIYTTQVSSHTQAQEHLKTLKPWMKYTSRYPIWVSMTRYRLFELSEWQIFNRATPFIKHKQLNVVRENCDCEKTTVWVHYPERDTNRALSASWVHRGALI